jgi:agmatinase
MKFVSVPMINGLNKTKGCEFAPEEVSKKLNKDFLKVEFNNDLLDEAADKIYEFAFKIFNKEKKVGFIGGDHSVSYPLTRAFFDYCDNSGKESCLIVFDAHPDCMEPVDSKFPTHEEWLRGLINDGFPTKNILLVGNRNSDKIEDTFLKKHQIRKIGMKNFLEDLNNSIESIMEFSNGKELYISIDIDFIDPAFAPGTGCPESGGLSSNEFLYLIERMSKMKNLKAIDLVEINPKKDLNSLTVKLGADILSKF